MSFRLMICAQSNLVRPILNYEMRYGSILRLQIVHSVSLTGKAAQFFSGSVVEALLLWAVDEHEGGGPGQAAAAAQALITAGRFTKLPPKDGNFWELSHLIEVALEWALSKGTRLRSESNS